MTAMGVLWSELKNSSQTVENKFEADHAIIS